MSPKRINFSEYVQCARDSWIVQTSFCLCSNHLIHFAGFSIRFSIVLILFKTLYQKCDIWPNLSNRNFTEQWQTISYYKIRSFFIHERSEPFSNETFGCRCLTVELWMESDLMRFPKGTHEHMKEMDGRVDKVEECIIHQMGLAIACMICSSCGCFDCLFGLAAAR